MFLNLRGNNGAILSAVPPAEHCIINSLSKGLTFQMLVRTDSKLYLKIEKLSEMGNFKDPDKGNETPGENNGIQNGIGVNNDEDQEMFNGNSARSGSADSDTDLEDEGVTFNDIDEDMEIEFKDSDDTFDQSLDRIVRNMVNQETRGIAEDIASMRMDVSESVRNLGDAEDLSRRLWRPWRAAGGFSRTPHTTTTGQREFPIKIHIQSRSRLKMSVRKKRMPG